MSEDRGFELIGKREITIYVDGILFLIPPEGRYVLRDIGSVQIHIRPYEIQRIETLEEI
jgi:hypothetical protein